MPFEFIQIPANGQGFPKNLPVTSRIGSPAAGTAFVVLAHPCSAFVVALDEVGVLEKSGGGGRSGRVGSEYWLLGRNGGGPGGRMAKPAESNIRGALERYQVV